MRIVQGNVIKDICEYLYYVSSFGIVLIFALRFDYGQSFDYVFNISIKILINTVDMVTYPGDMVTGNDDLIFWLVPM